MQLLSECIKRHMDHNHFYHITSDGGVRDFGHTMEAYFLSNIPRIAAFPT